MTGPEITFGEIFKYFISVVWNSLLVIVALASFAHAETPFQVLTFCFLLIIYVRLALFIEGMNAATASVYQDLTDYFMRLRVALNDVTPEEKTLYVQRQAVGWKSNEQLRDKRTREVRVVIRGVFSLVLFLIAAWNLVQTLL